MKQKERSSRPLRIALWTTQITASVFLLLGAIIKFMPVEKIAPMMPWTGEVSPLLLRLLGVADLLAAVGLIFPVLLNIRPQLTFFTACCVSGLMLSAIVFHVLRGEAAVTGFNFLLLAMGVFIAWGSNKAGIYTRE